MKDNFNKCLELLLKHEGGYVNHPEDTGGMTNLGVTSAVWALWVGHPVNEKQMKALTINDVAPLYKRKYWDACRADELVHGLDYAVFDVAVNSGVGRAIKLLQQSVGATPDGDFGSITFALIQKSDATRTIELLCARRMEFLQNLKSFPVFGNGWSKRVAEVKQGALSML